MTGLYLLFFKILIGNVYTQILNVTNVYNPYTVFPHDVEDRMQTSASSRIINMTYELIIEAKLLQRQMQPIQDFYQGQVTYEMGYVMGKIRERYKRMIEIYKQAHYMTKHLYLNTTTNETSINPAMALKPGIRMYYPINWIINMEYIRLFEVDIDKLIEVLENIPDYALPKFNRTGPVSVYPKFPDPGDGPPGGVMRPPYKKPGYEPGAPGTAVAPPGTYFISRTGGGPGYPPGSVGSLRSGPPSVPNVPSPSVPNEQPLSVSNEPRPSVPNEQPLSVSNEPSPSASNEPQPSVPNEPQPSVPNEPQPSVPNEPGPSVSNEPRPSVPNEPRPSVPTEHPSSQTYYSPPIFPNEPKALSNEPPLDPARQYHVVPRNQPYKPPPGQLNEQPQGPLSWPTEPPAASYGKTNRFGSANTNFQTEEELKRYLRGMYYREKPDGINDKFENLYR